MEGEDAREGEYEELFGRLQADTQRSTRRTWRRLNDSLDEFIFK